MRRKKYLILAIFAFALANAGVCFAQEETAEQGETQAEQPVYAEEPAPQTENIQYIVIPPKKKQQDTPAAPASATPVQQTEPLPPPPPRESNFSLLFGADLSFYLTSQSYDEDSKYDLYESDDNVVASQDYSGKGFAIGLSMGTLIRDIVGIRGFINVGMQFGEASYENKEIPCDSCSDVSTDLTDVHFGAEVTLFPFNGSKNALYNAYFDFALGASVHSRDDEFASYFDRDETLSMLLKFEVGKLFPISKSWNVGVGIAYSLDIQYLYTENDVEQVDYSDIGHSLWAGVRLLYKKNKI